MGNLQTRQYRTYVASLAKLHSKSIITVYESHRPTGRRFRSLPNPHSRQLQHNGTQLQSQRRGAGTFSECRSSITGHPLPTRLWRLTPLHWRSIRITSRACRRWRGCRCAAASATSGRRGCCGTSRSVARPNSGATGHGSNWRKPASEFTPRTPGAGRYGALPHGREERAGTYGSSRRIGPVCGRERINGPATNTAASRLPGMAGTARASDSP